MRYNNQVNVKYSEQSMSYTLQHIEEMAANFGGTDITTPLSAAKSGKGGPANKRVFILTDGQVNNPEEVIKKAAEDNERVRVFTFGLGSGCDQ